MDNDIALLLTRNAEEEKELSFFLKNRGIIVSLIVLKYLIQIKILAINNIFKKYIQ